MICAVAAALALGLVPAPAQTPTPAPPTAEQQRELELVALARARTELLERVRGLPVASGATVGAWLARDVNVDRGLRLWTRTRPRQGSARIYSDGVCEADARIEPAELLQELMRLLSENPSSGDPVGIDADKLKAAARAWPILWATGRTSLSRRRFADQPPGWEDVNREGLELARGAATADAYNALLAEAGRLKVTNARRLREFLDSSEAVRDVVQTEMQQAVKAKVAFEPDQVAVATVRISMRDLLRILTRAHQEHYRGEDFEAADFREMVLLAAKDELTGTGLATPPARTLGRSQYAPLEQNAPEWVGTTLSAVGQYEPAEGEPPDETARREAARLDGVTRLWKQAQALLIQKNVTVAEFLGYYQDLKDDAALFLNGARVGSAPTSQPSGGVEVRVELPLRRLWEIVRRDMKLEEIEPDDAGVADAAPASRPASSEKEDR